MTDLTSPSATTSMDPAAIPTLLPITPSNLTVQTAETTADPTATATATDTDTAAAANVVMSPPVHPPHLQTTRSTDSPTTTLLAMSQQHTPVVAAYASWASVPGAKKLIKTDTGVDQLAAAVDLESPLRPRRSIQKKRKSTDLDDEPRVKRERRPKHTSFEERPDQHYMSLELENLPPPMTTRRKSKSEGMKTEIDTHLEIEPDVPTIIPPHRPTSPPLTFETITDTPIAEKHDDTVSEPVKQRAFPLRGKRVSRDRDEPPSSSISLPDTLKRVVSTPFGTPIFEQPPNMNEEPNAYVVWLSQRLRNTMDRAPYPGFRVRDLLLSLELPQPSPSSQQRKINHVRQISLLLDHHDVHDVKSRTVSYSQQYGPYIMKWIEHPIYIYEDPEAAIKKSERQKSYTTQRHKGWTTVPVGGDEEVETINTNVKPIATTTSASTTTDTSTSTSTSEVKKEKRPRKRVKSEDNKDLSTPPIPPLSRHVSSSSITSEAPHSHPPTILPTSTRRRSTTTSSSPSVNGLSIPIPTRDTSASSTTATTQSPVPSLDPSDLDVMARSAAFRTQLESAEQHLQECTIVYESAKTRYEAALKERDRIKLEANQWKRQLLNLIDGVIETGKPAKH